MMSSDNIAIPNHLEVHPLGTMGETEIVPLTNDVLNISYLPCGLPPILPSLNTVLKGYLENIEKLPIFHIDAVQRIVPSKPNIPSLFATDFCPLQTTLKVKRNLATGKLLGFTEEVKDNEGTSNTSTSLCRAPGRPETSIMGSTSSFPFWPGGMDEPWTEMLQNEEITNDLYGTEFLDTPPGFKCGMQFEKHDRSKRNINNPPPDKIYLTDILAMEEPINLLSSEETVFHEENEEINLQMAQTEEPTTSTDHLEIEDNIFTTETSAVLDISKMSEKTEKPSGNYEWAVVMNTSQPVVSFHEQVPDMAFKWPFELDIFQKRAVLHLENRESVFVAAHTSAGKTVVAEYAIALAQKHMTRVIYTSPIKALSNQKYRDFKMSFQDVGIITGDVQVNPTAFCLIMTTEILRSMLYHGSDVVRELEWVIFDEVHYINDAERGVVWEEVLIMLPEHVNLILLSATVPNTVEFAEWLGRIKKRKIYVISTQKRPVPLEYFLYTGSVGKTESELFLLVNETGKFLNNMYQKAVDAKKARESKSKKYIGPKGTRYNVSYQQEKNIYIGLLGLLRKDNQLPVVCFTLSRNRCDEHAEMLTSLDLTTQEEKNEIVNFVKKSISKLKVVDRKLPQVKRIQELLKRGLGVHHSGILPILKEVVEMLFQKGLVKVLFATETFAMGVNMPARTVVFDSIRKHDGINFRDLKPSEFIQMAGRAGRRGLDKTGMVIMLCKADVPEMSSLYNMMLGKPTKLESKFRLTYSMILNLLKIRKFKVEDVMKRSFGETGTQKEISNYQHQLNEATSKLSEIPKLECSLCSSDLQEYYKSLEYLKDYKKVLMKRICSYAVTSKILTPGRILLVSTSYHQNVPGILLNVEKDNTCKILVIFETTETENSVLDLSAAVKIRGSTYTSPDLSTQSSSNAKPWSKQIFFPNKSKPQLLIVSFEDIQTICNKTLKIDAEKVASDWKKQQMSQFTKSSLGHNMNAAFQELISYSEAHLEGFSFVNMNFKDLELMERYLNVEKLENSLTEFKCIQCPEFAKHFKEVSDLMILQKQISEYKYQMSEESLHLHPEYEARRRVLKNLGYVDDKDNVQLKGSVAREMNNHELLITELLVKNVFGSCTPEEISALLSCMVFEQRGDEKKLNLPPALLKRVEEVKEVAYEIGVEQVNCGLLEPVMDFVDKYKFGLANVVYEWAKGTAFSEIMELTDVQEGIIVRCIQRLSELLKDVRNGATLVGDTVLAKKMEDSSRLIKRDIVFAASLYIQ